MYRLCEYVIINLLLIFLLRFEFWHLGSEGRDMGSQRAFVILSSFFHFLAVLFFSFSILARIVDKRITRVWCVLILFALSMGLLNVCRSTNSHPWFFQRFHIQIRWLKLRYSFQSSLLTERSNKRHSQRTRSCVAQALLLKQFHRNTHSRLILALFHPLHERVRKREISVESFL